MGKNGSAYSYIDYNYCKIYNKVNDAYEINHNVTKLSANAMHG